MGPFWDTAYKIRVTAAGRDFPRYRRCRSAAVTAVQLAP